MFDFAKRIWREVRRLFDYTTLKTALGRELTLSQSMVEALESWGGMMDGKAPWCVDPVVSLRIESGICREFADAVLVEMESSILNNDRLDAAYQRGLLDLNENLQDGLGFGSFILRPLGADRTEFVTADKFVPVRFDDSGNAGIVKSLHQALHLIVDRFTDFAAEIDIQCHIPGRETAYL